MFTKVGDGVSNPRFYIIRIRSKEDGEAQIYFENELVFSMILTYDEACGARRDYRHAVRVSGAYVGAKMYITLHDHSGNTGNKNKSPCCFSVILISHNTAYIIA